MRYERYSLGRLGTIKKVKGQPLDKYEFGTIPYVTGSQSNNGVIGYVSAPDDTISDGNCIAIDPIKGLCMYQPDDFVGRGFSGASINLLYIDELNETNAMYIIAAIEKYSTRVASYANLFNSNRLSSAEIVLPTLNDLDENSPYSDEGFVPDFDYMQERIEELEQERIEELEQERIEELEQYLIATGLNDYELTDEDREVLSLSSFRCYEDGDKENISRVYKEFKIGNLFTSQNGDTDIKKEDITGRGLPVITSGVDKCGVLGLTDIKMHSNKYNSNIYYHSANYKITIIYRNLCLYTKKRC